MAKTILLEALPPDWSAWSSLRPYLNAEWVTQKLIARHGVGKKYHHYVAKQARQIKYSLLQAQEHWSAANLSTAATRPLHLYYSCMCLALAEILWRGDGLVSIDKMRETDGRHGLEFKCSQKLLDLSSLHELKVKPHIAQHQRSGTFDVWHKHTRAHWLVGKKTDLLKNQTSVEVIFGPTSERLPLLPEQGVALYDLYASHPRMNLAMGSMGLNSQTVRATLELRLEHSDCVGFDTKVSTLVGIHPGRAADIEKMKELMVFSPRTIQDLNIQEHASGFQLIQRRYHNKHGFTGDFYLPDGMSLSASAVYFAPWVPFLNEFGFFYCGTYLLGMLCRYYPDLWMSEIERSSEFFYLATEFMQIAAARMPILCLGVLSETVYVRDDIGMSV